jgi:tRNA/rRNA methyltransferase
MLKNIAIILVEPQIPENIGAAARAMNNMGVTRLILVKPENCDLTRILKMATGTSIDIVEDMEVYDHLAEAIGPFHYVVGTTARIGAHRPALTNPKDLAKNRRKVRRRPLSQAGLKDHVCLVGLGWR